MSQQTVDVFLLLHLSELRMNYLKQCIIEKQQPEISFLSLLQNAEKDPMLFKTLDLENASPNSVKIIISLFKELRCVEVVNVSDAFTRLPEFSAILQEYSHIRFQTQSKSMAIEPQESNRNHKNEIPPAPKMNIPYLDLHAIVTGSKNSLGFIKAQTDSRRAILTGSNQATSKQSQKSFKNVSYFTDRNHPNSRESILGDKRNQSIHSNGKENSMSKSPLNSSKGGHKSKSFFTKKESNILDLIKKGDHSTSMNKHQISQGKFHSSILRTQIMNEGKKKADSLPKHGSQKVETSREFTNQSKQQTEQNTSYYCSSLGRVKSMNLPLQILNLSLNQQPIKEIPNTVNMASRVSTTQNEIQKDNPETARFNHEESEIKRTKENFYVQYPKTNLQVISDSFAEQQGSQQDIEPLMTIASNPMSSCQFSSAGMQKLVNSKSKSVSPTSSRQASDINTLASSQEDQPLQELLKQLKNPHIKQNTSNKLVKIACVSLEPQMNANKLFEKQIKQAVQPIQGLKIRNDSRIEISVPLMKSLFCTNLLYLNISNNGIKQNGLQLSLIMLEYIDISNNFLENLSIVKNCINLTEVQAQQNQLTSVQGLQDIKNLQILDLSHNQIKSFETILQLKKNETIRAINLSNNPVHKYPNYKRFIKQILPQSERIDCEFVEGSLKNMFMIDQRQKQSLTLKNVDQNFHSFEQRQE